MGVELRCPGYPGLRHRRCGQLPIQASLFLSETAEADIERNDLKESGIGNGAHGFEIMIDWSSIPDDTYMIKLSVNGTALPLAYQYNTATKIIKNATLVSLGTFKTTAYCPCRSCPRATAVSQRLEPRRPQAAP